LPGGAREFTITHQYLDDNPTATASDVYNISAQVTDDDGGSDSATRSTTVSNVAPVITNLSVTPTIDENGVVTLHGVFTDPGTQDTYTLSINWGEGADEIVS